MSATYAAIDRALRARRNTAKARVLRWFFKTGPGEYGEGDRFLGIVVPELRRLVPVFQDASQATLAKLLRDPVHEKRLLALLVLVHQFERGGETERRAIAGFYLSHTAGINNWDLVDLSAPNIVGAHLMARNRSMLRRLARSKSLWERRISIVATHAFIRAGEFDDTFTVADILMRDREDLIHKACGWMLREVGKRDQRALELYLRPRIGGMPRTMLRYAIERFPERLRRQLMRR
jgi:3-methyladenine DNA glycosylase AlkD